MTRKERLDNIPVSEAERETMIEKNSVMLDPPMFDKSICGVLNNGRVVYDYHKLIDALMYDFHSFEDAEEWVNYNTIRAVPYMPDPKPFISGGECEMCEASLETCIKAKIKCCPDCTHEEF